MKNSTIYVAVFTAAILFILGQAFSSGAAAAGGAYRTGAPSAGGGTESTCSGCHNSGASNFGEPDVSITVAATAGGAQVPSYMPGQTYFVSVDVSAPMGAPAAYGFQSVFLTSNNTQAGTFSSPGAMTQISNGPGGSGRFYPEHSARTPSGNWTFQWTAPSQGTGSVTIYGVGNSVNSANGSGGDSGSTAPTTLTLTEQSLPVELASINARAEKSEVTLNWVTATEDNVSHFEVERSSDGETFTMIDQVSAYGSSRVERGYNLTDESAPNGANFYRLRMVDLDDSYAYSPVVSANVEQEEVSLGAFPNPADGMVSFSPNISPETRLIVRNSFGSQLWAGQAGNGLDLSTYPAGIYLLEAVVDGERTVERVVKR